MEAMLNTLLTQLPNLAIAVWMLWQQKQTIDSLLSTQTKLIDRLLDYVDADKARAAAAIEQARRQ